jgi:diguanylate cyclase (GGDEF)-like protein/PAS domain S-box-containing protein
MKLNPLTLKFSGKLSKLEALFQSDYYRVSLLPIRISLVLGALFYASFGILDALLMPEQKYTIWFIRFVIVCPALVGTLLASFLKSFERYMQPLLASVFILAGGGIIYIIVLAPSPVNYFHNAGLLLVLMWGYTFIRILFTWASLAGWAQVVLYEIAAIWIHHTPHTVLLNNSFFFISANVIGMLACYSIEYYARRDFFLRQRLKIEQKKVNNVNQELERRVEKRTTDYQIINSALQQEITRHKLAESQREAALDALRESEEKYRVIFESFEDIYYETDLSGNITLISPSVYRISGWKTEELIGQPATLVYDTPEDRSSLLAAVLSSGYVRDYELKLIKRDGSKAAASLSAHIIYDSSGTTVGLAGSLRDMTERKQAEEALRDSEERYRTLVENASDIVIRTDNAGHFTFVNPAAMRITGYEEEEMIGMHYTTLIHPDMRDEAIKSLGRQFVKVLPNTYSEFPIIRKDGTDAWLGQNTQLIVECGNITGFQAVSRDITDRKRLEKELKESEERYRELSVLDDLTGLYNSRNFYFQLKMEIDRLARYEQPLTLLMLDLDNFKAFNDAYGHVEGDQVLQRFGQVVKRCLRETDFAYRYGGEEFTILLPMTTSADGAVTAERIRTEFKKEIFSTASGQDVHLTVSIGLAQYKPQEDIKAFVRRVDQLMYQGKKNGKDRVCSES